MTVLVYSERALRDLERLSRFLGEREPATATATARLIVSALDMLRAHPQVGRPVEHPLRELVISRGRTGYVALYVYDELTDMATVHAIRHQREAGYR